MVNYHLLGWSIDFQEMLGNKTRKAQRATFGSLLTLLCGLSMIATESHAVSCPEFSGRGRDYTNSHYRELSLAVVESNHFTGKVRTLREGESGRLIDDIEYTLNFFPNHHQALDALARLALREGTTRPERSDADLECRFKWAANTQPNDPMVPAIRGIYYYRAGQLDEAEKSLRQAVNMAPQNAELNYNLGLVLFSQEDYESARKKAQKAYKLGYPLPGLKNMLKEKGYPL